jgi:hypothetical protein
VQQAEENQRAYAHINEDEFPSQTIKQHYEVLHAYLNALALINGIKTTGEGAHKELLTYAQQEKYITGEDYSLLDLLRTKRNALVYEGTPIKKEFLPSKERSDTEA